MGTFLANSVKVGALDGESLPEKCPASSSSGEPHCSAEGAVARGGLPDAHLPPLSPFPPPGAQTMRLTGGGPDGRRERASQGQSAVRNSASTSGRKAERSSFAHFSWRGRVASGGCLSCLQLSRPGCFSSQEAGGGSTLRTIEKCGWRVLRRHVECHLVF